MLNTAGAKTIIRWFGMPIEVFAVPSVSIMIDYFDVPTFALATIASGLISSKI